MLERIMDIAADELGIDPVELPPQEPARRRRVPVHHAHGRHLRQRRLRRRAARGRAPRRLRRSCGPSRPPAGRGGDRDAARHRRGRVRRGDRRRRRQRVRRRSRCTRTAPPRSRSARPAHGQGHATSFAMIVADRLGIPMESIRFVQSDTAARAARRGHGRLAVAADRRQRRRCKAAEAVLERAKEIAAPPARGRRRRHRGDRRRPPRRGRRARPGPYLGRASADGGRSRRRRRRSPWASTSTQEGATFPFGAHVAVVEVDTETGQVELLRHVAVDDCGRILNPLLVTGQQHGGIAQGIAQALWEQVVYDDDGNPLTATLADYAMPSAAEFPSFEASEHRDADAAQPARGQGHRGVGHDRLHAGGAERRGRRLEPPRRPPHRHAVHARAGVAGDPGRRARHAAARCGVSRRRSSPACRSSASDVATDGDDAI